MMRVLQIGKIGRWLGELPIQTTNPFPEKTEIVPNTTDLCTANNSVTNVKKTSRRMRPITKPSINRTRRTNLKKENKINFTTTSSLPRAAPPQLTTMAERIRRTREGAPAARGNRIVSWRRGRGRRRWCWRRIREVGIRRQEQLAGLAMQTRHRISQRICESFLTMMIRSSRSSPSPR